MAEPLAIDEAPVRLAWFHCFSGVAGDMALGALVDAGADLAGIEAICRRLPVDGWRLEAEPVLRGGVAATKVHVHTPHEHHHRTWATIRAMLDGADLPPSVYQRATAVFGALARAEGALHRMPADDVHFHEVGAVDAIIDIVGTAAALHLLGVDHVHCSPVAVGLGTVAAAHGTLPNPAPAVVRLLAHAHAPTVGIDLPIELTTPTGAAIVSALSERFGPMPAMAIDASGFGAGSADPEGRVNATQVILGTRVPAPITTDPSAHPVTLLETTVDDATGEVLASAVAALIDQGAHDAWITPVVMKKGRPGHVVSALVAPEHAEHLAVTLRSSTGSLGVRGSTLQRWPAARHMHTVHVDGHAVRVKASPARAKAEHDDVVAVAAATGRPVPQVAARAEAAWWAEHGYPPPT